MDMHEQGDPEENFELKDLSSNHNGSRSLGSTFDPEFEDFQSDEEEKSPSFLSSRKDSAPTLQTFMLYTPDEERSIIRKFDYRLVMFVALSYMLSFLDRSNIGNARIAGLSEDLHLSSLQYEWLLRVFYITYILFEHYTLASS